jgi:hypothetical protein
MRKAVLLVLLILFTANTASAAEPVRIILNLGPLANVVNVVTNILGGVILDRLPGTNTYLVKVQYRSR